MASFARSVISLKSRSESEHRAQQLAERSRKCKFFTRDTNIYIYNCISRYVEVTRSRYRYSDRASLRSRLQKSRKKRVRRTDAHGRIVRQVSGRTMCLGTSGRARLLINKSSVVFSPFCGANTVGWTRPDRCMHAGGGLFIRESCVRTYVHTRSAPLASICLLVADFKRRVLADEKRGPRARPNEFPRSFCIPVHP